MTRERASLHSPGRDIKTSEISFEAVTLNIIRGFYICGFLKLKDYSVLLWRHIYKNANIYTYLCDVSAFVSERIANKYIDKSDVFSRVSYDNLTGSFKDVQFAPTLDYIVNIYILKS